MTLFSLRTAVLMATILVVPSLSARAAFEFIPSAPATASSAPAMSAPPATMGMTPAPAADVVSEALSQAVPRTAPQAIVPPAPLLPQYSLARPAPAPSRSAPGAMPVINMNPLSMPDSQPVAPAQIEQAMAQAATPQSRAPRAMPASRSSLGGLPLPPPEQAAPAAGGFVEAVGFGRDLPLPLAVSQIVPPDYAFSFDQSINPGDTVSWEGGKPWDQVLNDTLAGAGATARIDTAKKEIAIVPAASSGYTPAAYTAPAPTPAAAPAPRPPSVAPAAMMSPAPAPTMSPPPVRDVSSLSAVPPIMTEAPSAVPVILDPKAVTLWEAARGATLRTILEDWSMRAGVELFWSSDFDFPVESAIRIKGTFEEAVQTLLNGLRDAQPRPIGRLHPNLPEGPSVLVIETKHILE